jgi:hypothetical protein
MNREAWLHTIASDLAGDFLKVGKPFPSKLAISVGFPSRGATSMSKRVIGQCWNGEACKDGTFHIFISPVLKTGLEAADTLVHELCHAVLPSGTGHKGPFAKLATTMGLEGKPTSTNAGKALTARLNALIKKVGTYPHSGLQVVGRTKVQTTRLLKVSCPTCDYTVRVTRSWLEIGNPVCPVDGIEMEEQE